MYHFLRHWLSDIFNKEWFMSFSPECLFFRLIFSRKGESKKKRKGFVGEMWRHKKLLFILCSFTFWFTYVTNASFSWFSSLAISIKLYCGIYFFAKCHERFPNKINQSKSTSKLAWYSVSKSAKFSRRSEFKSPFRDYQIDLNSAHKNAVNVTQ